MKKYKKIQKGFTLIELLMVVAIIAILSSIILISLNSGREKAELNRYTSYAAQMYRSVAAAVAAGQINDRSGFTAGQSFCLGDVGYECGSSASAVSTDDGLYKAVTYLAKMPETNLDNACSPYRSGTTCQGVSATYKPTGTNPNPKAIRVNMYVISDDSVFLNKVCNSMKWNVNTNGYCYIDVPLNTRM